MDKLSISRSFKHLQNNICNSLTHLDGKNFEEDVWNRPGGGGGITRIINGNHIEKGGVNFSEVYGILSKESAATLGINPGDFYATGVSIVLHPKNPNVPIIHMNVRYFEASNTWWFGGGIDVTPHYIDVVEASYFHTQLKKVCDEHDQSFYAEFKKWADNYFYIPHRKETRGIGGIFFDRLSSPQMTKEKACNFTMDVGATFVPVYRYLFDNNFQKSYTEKQKEWQLLRRGRYVEFNLVWDRGTKFGLHTDGRTESILMSLPMEARWYYKHEVEKDSREAETLNLLVKGVDWINYSKI